MQLLRVLRIQLPITGQSIPLEAAPQTLTAQQAQHATARASGGAGHRHPTKSSRQTMGKATGLTLVLHAWPGAH